MESNGERQRMNPDFSLKNVKYDKNLEKKVLLAINELSKKRDDKSHLLYHLNPSSNCLKEVKKEADRLASFSDTLIVVGIGGSSLSSKIFESIKKKRRVIFFEGIDEREIMEKVNSLKIENCSLNIISKSGNTLETIANSAILIEKFKKGAGKNWKERVILTTSEGSGRLQNWAKKENIKMVEIPAPVGGRFSSFTPVGLLPSSFLSLKIENIASGVEKGLENGFKKEVKENCSALLSLFYLYSSSKGFSNIYLWGFGKVSQSLSLWIQQLWDESLGKGGIGLSIIPLKGSEDQHSVLQLLVEGPQNFSTIFFTDNYKKIKINKNQRRFIGIGNQIKFFNDLNLSLKEGAKNHLVKNKVPLLEFSLGKSDEEEIAKVMTQFIISTLIIAEVCNINPLGQSGVEESKQYTRSLIL